jgi:hypothetical protein
MLSFSEFFKHHNKPSLLHEDDDLLLEGGVAGHMSHLYDNWNLTFGKIKEIIYAAGQGELQGTEKTDGQNLFISYSVKDGVARSARNKGNIKTGGMSVEQLKQKFSGRGPLEDTFTDALRIFEKAVRSLSPTQQIKIFGEDTNVWYNAEIMDPRTANVINYDKKSLVIHRVGHAWFDKETGEPTDIDVSANAIELSNALETMQEAIQDEDYAIIQNAIRRLERLSNDKPIYNAIESIDALMARNNLSDENTIQEYIENKFMEHLSSVLSPEILEQVDINALIKRLMGEKGYNIVQIIKPLELKDKTKIKEIIKQAPSLLKSFVFPIENIIHDFAVEVLKGVQSAYIINNEKEVRRLRKEVESAIRAIENSNNEVAHSVLKDQLKKLRSVDKINSAIEGFVFDYDGQTYKLVSSFAPVNQLLGLFKYGRAGVKPEEFQ